MANHIEKRKRPLAIHSTATEVKYEWPSWRYNPKTGKGQIFQSEDEVPDGWVEHYNDTTPGKRAIEGHEEGEESRENPTNRVVPGSGGDEEEPEELEDIDDITAGIIKKRLDRRGVPYPASADKPKLYALLEENWEIEEA